MWVHNLMMHNPMQSLQYDMYPIAYISAVTESWRWVPKQRTVIRSTAHNMLLLSVPLMLLLGLLLLLAEIKHCFECFLLDCFHQSDEKKWYVFWLIYLENNCASSFMCVIPDNKVHGANMGPTWVLSAPDGLPCWPHESWVCHISICLIVT